jgi:hypothetical protein
MKRLAAAIAACASLLAVPSPARAATVGATPVVLVTVDSVTVSGTTMRVVGVVEGDPAPSEWVLPLYTSSTADAHAQVQACQRLALLAMSRPGAYRLTLSKASATSYAFCTLSRVTP